MKNSIFALLLLCCMAACEQPTEEKQVEISTVCNPMNLSYRFQLEEPSRREAADPMVITFKGKYFLFASKSGGYWYSDDLTEWNFIRTDEIPTEEYAPTAIALQDTVYFLASSAEKSTIYKSADPLSGHWMVAREVLDMPVWDPAFFLDSDDRLYLYWGCSNEKPLYGVELDDKNFDFVGQPRELLFANPSQHGWEIPGDYNTRKETAPWIEGAWVNKHNGRYYLQYAGPGTEFKSYADAVYTSDKPLGPFEPAAHNPFAYKPEGFAAGAGHGCTFSDQWGNYWHIGTITISTKHMFERRLGLYPAFFDADGVLHAVTKYGDYPMIIPQQKTERFEEIFPEWMLLSYKKKVEVSSSIDSLPAANMVDENIRTYWSAATGSENEWAALDLGDSYDIHAVQINFAEHNTGIFGRAEGLSYQYMLEYSDDGNSWKILADKSENQSDRSHVYLQLPQKVSSRYLRIRNKKMPDGTFAISGFRVFGKGSGEQPEPIAKLDATRNPSDPRTALLQWSRSERATGYVISFGSSPDKLYSHYMVYEDTLLILNVLDSGQSYSFAIEAFNENGITPGELAAEVE